MKPSDLVYGIPIIASTYFYGFNTIPLSLLLFFTQPSLKTLSILIMSFFGSILVGATLSYFENIAIFNECVLFFRKFSNCYFARYNLFDYLQINSQAKEIIKLDDEENFKQITILVVKKGNSKIVPNSYKAFPIQNDGIIFIRDEPEVISPIGKFFLYHEVGHCSLTTKSVRFQLKATWKPYIFFIAWVVINCTLNLNTLLLLIFFIFVLIIGYKSLSKFTKSYLNDMEEINADLFAVNCLSADERKKVLIHLEKNKGLLYSNGVGRERERSTMRALRNLAEKVPILPRYTNFETYFPIFLTLISIWFGKYLKYQDTTGIIVNIALFCIIVCITFISALFYKYEQKKASSLLLAQDKN